MPYRQLRDLVVPGIGTFAFFLIQSLQRFSEIELLIIFIIITGIIFWDTYYKGEAALFLVGFIMGLIIEVGMRYIGAEQIWLHATYFAVPIWLPFVWGIGFVVITRIGLRLRTQ